MAATSDVTVTGTGATRQVAVAARGRGYTDLTLKVTGLGGKTATKTLHYAASAAVQTRPRQPLLRPAPVDASAAVDVGGGYAVVADDESNTLRLYDRSASGAPVRTWDFSSKLGVSKEIDIEGAARVGDTVYWTGSLGNNKDGEYKSARNTVFTTTVSGSGAAHRSCRSAARTRGSATTWSPGTRRTGTATASRRAPRTARSPKQIDGFNVEGLEFAPGSTTTAYVGFRAPLAPAVAGGKALLVPVTNFDKVPAAAPRPCSVRRSSWTSAGSPSATSARTPRTST